MIQRYTDARALQRMKEGRCPECGQGEKVHTGGGAVGCTLTEYGVSARLHEYRRRKDDQ